MMQQNDLQGKQSRPSGENRATCWDAYISGHVKDAPTLEAQGGDYVCKSQIATVWVPEVNSVNIWEKIAMYMLSRRNGRQWLFVGRFPCFKGCTNSHLG